MVINMSKAEKPEKSEKSEKKPPPKKRVLVAKQNAVLGTDEKKLMVSPAFLDEMTRRYVAQRINLIKVNAEKMSATKFPKSFFKRRSLILNALDELIELEKEGFYEFAFPLPSSYKENFLDEQKYRKNINALINRFANEVKFKARAIQYDEMKLKYYEAAFKEFDDFKEIMPPESLSLLDTIYDALTKKNRENDESDSDVENGTGENLFFEFEDDG